MPMASQIARIMHLVAGHERGAEKFVIHNERTKLLEIT
jgi:hypothetical protein